MNFRERYQFDPKTDLLGKGGFSKVYKAFDAIRKREVALKFYHGVWSEKYDVIGEIIRMGDLVHPYIIRYYDATIIESTNAIGEVEKIQVGILEYANSGDVTDLLQNKSVEVIKPIIRGVLEGLVYLHQHDIAHRDLKPKNLLLHRAEDGILVPKIADFGISKKMSLPESASTQLLGSVEYMAPEQFNPTKYGINGSLSTNMDLWSLGIIIYELFTQNTPFGNRSTGLSNEEILSNILFKDIVIEYNQLVEPFRTMVKKCLVKHAKDRVQSPQELLDILDEKISVETVQKEENFDANATQILQKPILEKKNIEPPKNEGIQIIQRRTTPRVQPTIETTPEPKNEQPSTPTVVQPYRKSQLQDETNFQKSIEQQRRVEPPKLIEQPKPKPKPKEQPKPIVPSRPQSTVANPQAAQHIGVGKNYFKEGNYVDSYRYLSPYQYAKEFDTEARFFLGFMVYNGKCGGTHSFEEGKELMEQAKIENRPLVGQLMTRYILNRKK